MDDATAATWTEDGRLKTGDIVYFDHDDYDPRRGEIRPEIPRNASGKVLKRVLRAPYCKGCDRRNN